MAVVPNLAPGLGRLGDPQKMVKTDFGGQGRSDDLATHLKGAIIIDCGNAIHV
jgi:hypothetical protein